MCNPYQAIIKLENFNLDQHFPNASPVTCDTRVTDIHPLTLYKGIWATQTADQWSLTSKVLTHEPHMPYKYSYV